MTKLVAVVGVLVLAHAAPGQTQERPDYSGTWALVEASSAAGARALGKEFKLTQSPTTMTIERTAAVTSGAVPPGGGAMVMERKDVKISIDYIFDGAEHPEVLPASMPGVGPAPPGAIVSAPANTTYRATWMKGQLIIVKQAKVENNALLSVSRWALSLDADGLLVFDSLNVPMLPRANGPKQEPPVSVRSVYKKAQ